MSAEAVSARRFDELIGALQQIVAEERRATTGAPSIRGTVVGAAIDALDDAERRARIAEKKYQIAVAEARLAMELADRWKFVPDEHGGHMLSTTTGDKWYPESFTQRRLAETKLTPDEYATITSRLMDDCQGRGAHVHVDLITKLRRAQA